MVRSLSDWRSASVSRAAVALLSLCGAATAHGQWTVTNLHPNGATSSLAYGVWKGQQVGRAYYQADGFYHGGVWSGNAATWVDFTPTTIPRCTVNGAARCQQVGDLNGRAMIWHGTAVSGSDLTPAGIRFASVQSTSGDQQVGWVYANPGGNTWPHASVWSGSAESWIDLHPAGHDQSYASGVRDGQQVGSVNFGDYFHASLWIGSAASWVDLNPEGSTNSWCYGVYGGQQVGVARVDDVARASLWNGSAASWVDMNPPGSTASVAFAVFNGEQVGYATVGDTQRASLWTGTAGSWVDLHALLPAGFNQSSALGIWSDANFTYVVGFAVIAASDQAQAILWTRRNSESVGCQPADIADDAGNPLPSTESNTGVNEGDYNAFFQGFFDALAQCDIADDAGDAPPTGCASNSGVNEGDYNAFFQHFFDGCP